MYGKVFEDIFCSTLMDHGGDTAYVFIAMIVLSDERGIIKHTESSLARLICKPLEVVQEAIRNLELVDSSSNIKAHDGRRIVPLHEIMDDETRGWLVVNKSVYRDRATREDKRKADRERIAEKRNRTNDVADSRKASRDVADVAYTDTDTDTDTRTTKDAGASRVEGFEILWKAYPTRSGNNPKRRALKAYKARLIEKHAPAEMLDGVARYARFVQATGKGGTEYVMQAATFLGPDKPFLQPWAPPNLSKAEQGAPKRVGVLPCDYCEKVSIDIHAGRLHCEEHQRDAWQQRPVMEKAA